ncbi:MAG: hypothetical protein ACPG1A_16945, partial [Halioglobus sp.]
AAVASVYAFIIALFVYRDMGPLKADTAQSLSAAVVEPVPRRSPLVSFPKPDRELQQGDVEAIESILRRLEHSTLECTDLDRLTADVRALGVRMAHTQGGSPLESSLPSPKRVRRLMDRLEQRRQDCASEGC